MTPNDVHYLISLSALTIGSLAALTVIAARFSTIASAARRGVLLPLIASVVILAVIVWTGVIQPWSTGAMNDPIECGSYCAALYYVIILAGLMKVAGWAAIALAVVLAGVLARSFQAWRSLRAQPKADIAHNAAPGLADVFGRPS